MMLTIFAALILELARIVFGIAASLRDIDLPPTNRASRSLVKFVFGEEDEHEEALYGTTNHQVSEG
ncbi:hypothetical protein, partial [Burkholderia pseudomallei]